MKPVNVLFFSSLFTYVVTSPLHSKGYAKHPSRRGRASDGLVSHVTKTVILTQTAYFTASQKESDITPTPLDSLDGPTTTSRHDGIATTTTKTSTSDFPTTLPGATTSDGCSQSFPCSGDITNYDPSTGNNACGDPVYQPTDSVIAIAYGMMGTLSSGTEKNPLCGRYVQIENPANGKTARGMVVDKCMGCVSG
jgi:hypothetical protein